MTVIEGLQNISPLSARQKEIFVEQEVYPGCALHNIGGYCWINGAIDIGALEGAIQATVAATDVLRLVLRRADPGQLPGQQFVGMPPIALNILEFSSEDAARAAMAKSFGEPFALYDGALYRIWLARISDIRHALVVKFHHIIGDAQAVMMTIARIASAYGEGAEADPVAPASFASLVDDEIRAADPAAQQTHQTFWRESLADLPPPLFVAEAHTATGAPAAHVREFDLPADTFARIDSCARGCDGSAFHALLVAVHACFGRRAGIDDLVLGVSLANRRTRAQRSAIGLTTSVAPIRLSLGAGQPLSVALRTIAAKLRRAYRHHHVPLSAMTSASVLRAAGRDRLCDITVTSLASPHGALALGTADVEVIYQLFSGFDAKPLQVFFNTMDSRRPARVSLVFNKSTFTGAAADNATQALRALLEDLPRHADPVLRDLPVLGPAERDALAERLRGAAVEVPGTCAHDAIDAFARRHPDAVAVVHDGMHWTYAELVDAAGRLAHSLQAMGAGPEVVVGVCVERSIEMVVAVLAVMKAGAAFLPLDASLPERRLAFVLADAAVAIVLVGKSMAAAPVALPAHIACVAVDVETLGPWPAAALRPPARAGQLAYVIYTSGSTGQPKGVQVTHQGLCNLMAAQRALFGVRQGDRVLQFARLCFDASVWEIVMALGAGATLCLAAAERLAPTELQRTLLQLGITVATLPPAALPFLQPEALPALKAVISAGEACPPDIAAAWAAHTRFFNAYGPTETSVCASVGRHEGHGKVSMGHAVANMRLRLLDPGLNPVAIGAPGELHVCGPGLARGYVGQASRTALRFVADPFEPGARMYRTGDMARLTLAGELEFLGRNDDQVKVRGFRVELGEIEAALCRHSDVLQAAAVKREFGPRDHRVMAYVTLRDGAHADTGEAALRAHLAGILPDYAVPAAVVVLQAMPLNANGKLDKRALPSSTVDRGAAVQQASEPAPRPVTAESGSALRLVRRIWSELLARDDVPVQANFFELGGDSLLLARALQMLNAQLPMELSFVDLLRHTTAQDLARHIEQRQAAQEPGGGAVAGARSPVARGRGLLARVLGGARLGGKPTP